MGEGLVAPEEVCSSAVERGVSVISRRNWTISFWCSGEVLYEVFRCRWMFFWAAVWRSAVICSSGVLEFSVGAMRALFPLTGFEMRRFVVTDAVLSEEVEG